MAEPRDMNYHLEDGRWLHCYDDDEGRFWVELMADSIQIGCESDEDGMLEAMVENVANGRMTIDWQDESFVFALTDTGRRAAERMLDTGDVEASDVASAWTVLRNADAAWSSDRIALLVTFEAMRLMLTSAREDYRRRANDGLGALLDLMAEALREHDPDGLDRLTESWRPEAERMGLEW